MRRRGAESVGNAVGTDGDGVGKAGESGKGAGSEMIDEVKIEKVK